jgi:hypothetical protein
MIQGIEKRICHRFEIPGSSLLYKKIGLFHEKKYIEAVRLLNISKGGVAFVCKDEFKIGKYIIVKIITPNDMSLELLSTICWQRKSSNNYLPATGVAFATFGKGSNTNPMESLEILRRWNKLYVKPE